MAIARQKKLNIFSIGHLLKWRGQVDKYESSAASGSVGHYSGNDTTAVAGSSSGVAPLASVTWFQAAVACANAGKRLCTNQEWTVACLGTPDTTSCNINSQGAPLNAGSLSNCKSRWGAYDMVGNVWEWTDAGLTVDNPDVTWSSGHTGIGDGTGWYTDDDGYWFLTTTGRAFIRGGAWSVGASSGCFTLSLYDALSTLNTNGGFRCCK